MSEIEKSGEVKETMKNKKSISNAEIDHELKELWAPNNESIKVENENSSEKAANKYIIEDGKALLILIQIKFIIA